MFAIFNILSSTAFRNLSRTAGSKRISSVTLWLGNLYTYSTPAEKRTIDTVICSTRGLEPKDLHNLNTFATLAPDVIPIPQAHLQPPSVTQAKEFGSLLRPAYIFLVVRALGSYQWDAVLMYPYRVNSSERW